MELPAPPRAVLTLAAFVRDRLTEMTDTLTPLWSRGESELTRLAGEDRLVAATARQFATVITGAAAPFAPTSYARARLMRQMHASGLLTDREASHTQTLMDLVEPGWAVDHVVEPAQSATGTEPHGVPRPTRRPRPRPC
jgi:hypothetical protein